jgi:hypothetical protein
MQGIFRASKRRRAPANFWWPRCGRLQKRMPRTVIQIVHPRRKLDLALPSDGGGCPRGPAAFQGGGGVLRGEELLEVHVRDGHERVVGRAARQHLVAPVLELLPPPVHHGVGGGAEGLLHREGHVHEVAVAGRGLQPRAQLHELVEALLDRPRVICQLAAAAAARRGTSVNGHKTNGDKNTRYAGLADEQERPEA